MYRYRDVEIQRCRMTEIIVSMVSSCNDIGTVITEHGERRLGLSNTPLLMEHDNNRTSRGITHIHIMTY